MFFCVNACFDGCLPAHIYKHLMNAVVFTKFRMKSKTNLIFVFHCDYFLINCCENLCRAGLCHIGSANKGHFIFADSFEMFFFSKTAKLSAIGITFHSNRQSSQMNGRIIVNVLQEESSLEMSDSALGHNRDADSFLDSFYHFGSLILDTPPGT